MANVSGFLQQMLNARYGKDVRQSIHDSINAINKQLEESDASALASAQAAQTAATEAKSAVNNIGTTVDEHIKKQTNIVTDDNFGEKANAYLGDIVEEEESTSPLSYEYFEKTTIDKQGNIKELSYAHLVKIGIAQEEYISIQGNLPTATNKLIVYLFKDSNGNVLTYGDEITDVLKVPSNATELYITIWSKNSLKVNSVVYSNKIIKSGLSNELYASLNYTELSFEKISNAYINYSNGRVGTLNNAVCTDYIPIIPKSSLIAYDFAAANNDERGYALYNKNKGFVQGVQYTNSLTIEITVPDDCYYVRFSSAKDTSKVYLDTKNNEFVNSFGELFSASASVNSNSPLSNLLQFGGFASCFEKIACIGDSLTAGNCNYNGETSGEVAISYTSYPSNIARLCGNTVYTMAKGGMTAVINDSKNCSWIKTNETLKWTDNVANAYIIALGTNDIGYFGEFTGEISDINMSDKNQTDTSTSVGGYGYIIQSILEQQPKAKIFCVTIPKSRNTEATRTVANTKIKAIAELFGCYVIDLYTDRQENYSTDTYYNGGHLNALGYNTLAREIITYIDYIIRNNMNEFQDIQFIGTDYSYSD